MFARGEIAQGIGARSDLPLITQRSEAMKVIDNMNNEPRLKYREHPFVSISCKNVVTSVSRVDYFL